MKENLAILLTIQELDGEEIDSFTRGHITVQGSQKIISSIGHVKDQSVMIFFSIVQLLDGIESLPEKNTKFEFVGEGSSFRFFVQISNGLICIEDICGNVVGEMNLEKFIISLWKEIERFMAKNGRSLCKQEIIYSDLQDSISQFKAKFKL